MIHSYVIDSFLGLNQAVSENKLPPGFTVDCANMDTEDGNLTVGMGYAKHISTKVPGSGTIWRMYYWHRLQNDLFIVCTGDDVYAWTGSAWTKIFDYTSILPASTHITSTNWDFMECRIGSTDYLLIANGETQLIKWKGSGSAEAFGSGEYVYEKTISSVAYNATKATAVSYAELNNIGTFTLTMPSGWTYAANKLVAFVCPADIGNLIQCNLSIGANTHQLEYVPLLSSGDIVTAKLLSTTEATTGGEYTELEYGIEKVTLSDNMSADVQTRCLNAGILLNGYSYQVSSIASNKILTLKNLCKENLANGQTAKVRGGLSNIPVNYCEIYMSRLFSAGDSSNPSRLYWSQPPGDTRSIEDWSMDDASDQTSGGFVDVGTTSADPIVGLCALSNQLLIIKEASLWRLLGDRPTNFRVLQINRDIEKTVNTSIIANGDVPYWLTRNGIYYHDGQMARLSPNSRQIHNILERVDLSRCRGCENMDRLYWTCYDGALSNQPGNTIIVYDLRERTFLLRTGFTVHDICAYDGKLYSINEKRYVYKWSRSAYDYDGDQIDAYWNTPFTDQDAKSVTKVPLELYARGEGGFFQIELRSGSQTQYWLNPMPSNTGDVIRQKLYSDEGRAFGMKIYNQKGSWFRMLGGVELKYEAKED